MFFWPVAALYMKQLALPIGRAPETVHGQASIFE